MRTESSTTPAIPADMTPARIEALALIRDGHHMRVHPAREQALLTRGYIARTGPYLASPTAITGKGRDLLKAAGR